MSDFSIRRREFVASATAAAAGMTFVTDALASGKSSLYHLTHADFAQLIGESFAVDGTSEQNTRQRGTLVLKEVVPHGKGQTDSRPSHLRSEPFSLHFEAQDVALAVGTHRVAGANLPACDVFLHEMLDQRQPGRRHFEAVFN